MPEAHIEKELNLEKCFKLLIYMFRGASIYKRKFADTSVYLCRIMSDITSNGILKRDGVKFM